MNKIFKFALLFAAATTMTLGFTACDDDDDNKETTEEQYKDRTYGNSAIEACENLGSALEEAYAVIGSCNLT